MAAACARTSPTIACGSLTSSAARLEFVIVVKSIGTEHFELDFAERHALFAFYFFTLDRLGGLFTFASDIVDRAKFGD